MSAPQVTDLELMLYVDGELEPDRVAAVEAELERSQRARDVVASLGHASSLICEVTDSRAEAAGADLIADEVMRRLDDEAGAKVVELPVRGSKAHRGSESTAGMLSYALGGIAAAAAVAFVIWRFAGASLTQPAPEPVAQPSLPTQSAEVASAKLPSPDFEPEPTVSVDAVDFGARTGTIFYVPADTGTTTIVWLSDDESGGM